MSNMVMLEIGNEKYSVEKGTTFEKFLKDSDIKNKSIIVAMLINNELKELTYEICEDSRVELVDLTSEDGIRIYQRSLKFLLIKAVYDLFPDREVEIGNSVRRGVFFEIKNAILTEEEVVMIENKMIELANSNIPFKKVIISTEKAREIFLEKGREDRYRAIVNREKPYVSFYVFDNIEDYFYGYMVPSTGYLKNFKLEFKHGGIIVVCPRKENPENLPMLDVPEKLFSVFTEYRHWVKILGVEDVGLLNILVNDGRIDEFIRISEALHEKKIANIADMIVNEETKKKLVLIAGPSSSGKTTFAQRLSIQLRVNGIIPVTISLDDYFVNQDKTPIDENGEKDFEALETVDLELFNEHLNKLIAGEEVEVPTYNFAKGMREWTGKKIRLLEGQVIVVEGIHGLNPKLTDEVDNNVKFKIYVSAITSMKIDFHNRIPTTDNRLVRRIVRDYQFRGCSAKNTINMWPSVRRGEEKNIFPYQEEADVMFNSSLIYELGVLKKYILPLLNEIEPCERQYAEARRLIEFLSYFETIESDEIPNNSIVKEFIGGSCFFKN